MQHYAMKNTFYTDRIKMRRSCNVPSITISSKLCYFQTVDFLCSNKKTQNNWWFWKEKCTQQKKICNLTAQDSQTMETILSRRALIFLRAASPWIFWASINCLSVRVWERSRLTNEMALCPTPKPSVLQDAASHRPRTCSRQPCNTSLAKNRRLHSNPLKREML